MNLSLPKIDVCIVCGRRPDLLVRTLDSFFKNILFNFHVENVYANVDPFCGSEKDGDKVIEILNCYFKGCKIFTPDSPSFGAAVKKLWMATKSDYILHLEDDWVALEKMNSIDLDSEFVGNVASLSFLTAEKKWNKCDGLFHTRILKKKIFGLTYKKIHVGCFTTSPCILKGEFARQCGCLMNPSLDPEKQFYNGKNLNLEKFSLNYTNKFIIGKKGDFIIKDIGREYRDQIGIGKKIVNGVSRWEPIK